MTFVSVAEAARRLGIDAKTLHHWIAEAQLPLQRHPHDGRKQGVSLDHVQVLARLHQRSLAPLQEEPPAAGGADALPHEKSYPRVGSSPFFSSHERSPPSFPLLS